MSLSTGTRLGSYEIVSPLGVGGMGEVYRARDTRLGRQVALKILPPAFTADAERMGRFEREAKLLASLNHPNIAAIYGFEDANHAPALVMELVEGQTLADRIAAGPIAAEEALPIAQQVCEALEFAHERGIVHRDLKPANVKITPEGAVKLLDFGLAKALEGDAAAAEIASSPTITRMATQAGIILGTAAYMSPEQAKGRPADRRADIWAFGCVLYEMLTAKMAFSGETVTDVLADVIRSEPDWALLPAATPPPIRRLIQRCLSKDVKRRLQAIGDARITIEEVLGGAVYAEAIPVVAVAGARPRRATLPWLAALLACAALSAALTWFFTTRGAPAPMRFRPITNFAGVQAQPSISPDGRSVAFISNRDGHYNVYVGLVDGGSLVQITTDAGVKSDPRWSPDGASLVYARLNDSGALDLWQVPALGGTPRRLILNAAHPDWSRDGLSLAYEDLATRTIWVADSTGQNPRQATPAIPAWAMDIDPRFSPDGRQLAYITRSGGPYGQLMLVDLASAKARALTQSVVLTLSPAWSPDGRFIYFCSSRGGTMNIWKISASGGEPEQITAGQGDDAQLDLSSDGRRLVFATFRENRNIAQVDLAAVPGAQSIKLLTADPARSQVAPVYSPDGKHVAYFSNLNGVEREGIWVADADGAHPVRLVQDDRINIFPRWTPDSQHLVYISEEPTSQHASNRHMQQQNSADSSDQYRSVSIGGGASEIISPAFDQAMDLDFDVGSGGRILFRTGEVTIKSFDPATKKIDTLGTLPTGQRNSDVRWAPDGQSIAFMVSPARDDDPNAGVWVTDFKNPPRRVFTGWALGYSRGPANMIYVLQGKPDYTADLWKVGWDGRDLARVTAGIPLAYSFWDTGRGGSRYFDVSPDGRRMIYVTQGVLQANLGMIDGVR